ncbi:MAG TPA: peptidase MA family metallohydrolase [Terriglobales bacterium]|nr:peptidase MA family metallohydrolase [Terriglobales bacterium]
MRVVFTIALLALTTVAGADTIHLKNGRTILADVVRQEKERVEYDIGDDTYAIPISFVDHVDAGVGTPSSSGESVNIAAPKVETGNSSRNLDGKITPERLAQIERQGSKQELADALIVLGIQDQQQGKHDDARAHLQRAVSVAPENGEAAAIYAWVLLKQDQATIAENYAEDAVRKNPDSGFAHKILGLIYYKLDKLQDSVEELNKAKQLEPNDKEVEYYLKTITRQAKAEADFRSDASAHFNMRYEGDKATPKLREEILLVLERHFDDLVSNMGLLPRDPIIVVLYTNQTYFDVTLAPAWTAALNDGKLRIPVEGITGVTPEMSRVLKHELAHSFIRQATGGKCPVWLNEGFAQLVEPQSAARYRSQLARLFADGKQAPLQSLEGSFIGYDSSHAAVAYVESLAYVEYIRDTYGMNRISDMMRYLSEGQSSEEALKSATHNDYSQLEDEFARHLR